MRKQAKKRINYGFKPKAPVLVLRGIHETNLEIRERATIDNFSRGWATQDDFMLLQDMLNLMLIAGQSSGSRRYALSKSEQAYKPVVEIIQKRYERTGKWGMTGEEMNTMHDMISFSRTFWMRQPAELLIVCQAELKAFYKEQRKEVAA